MNPECGNPSELPLSSSLKPASDMDAGGVPTDSEFGPFKVLEDGCQLELSLDCPPNGQQTLEVFLSDTAMIDPVQRGILREILAEWPAIWAEASKAWFRENPREKKNLTAQRDWVLEAEIASEKTIAEEFEGDPIWRLSVSGDSGSTVLALMMEGAEVLDAELL